MISSSPNFLNMKKILFYISLIITIYIVYIISNIFIYHFDKLNNFGLGFLIGELVLLVIFSFLTYKIRPEKKKNQYFQS
jgi:hypothetical protein